MTLRELSFVRFQFSSISFTNLDKKDTRSFSYIIDIVNRNDLCPLANMLPSHYFFYSKITIKNITADFGSFSMLPQFTVINRANKK